MTDKPYEIFEKDGKLYGRDAHGEFALDAGTKQPQEGRCNATLRFHMQRYGEKRYCGQYPIKYFTRREDDSSYCRHHSGYENADKMIEDNFKTGAYTKSYTDLFSYLEPHKQVVATKLFRDLLEESSYDFEVEYANETINTKDVDWTEDDVIVIEFPVPSENEYRAKALWFAALEFVKMENVEQKLFEDAFVNDTGVGERSELHSVSEFGETRDMGEHHLNLPLSRMIKDHKDLLKIGGVRVDGETDESASGKVREWVFSVDEPTRNEDPFKSNTDV